LTGENDSDEILTDHRLRMPTELFSQAVEGKNSLLLADRTALNSGAMEATGGRKKEESNELGPRRTLVKLTERWTSREKSEEDGN
jgi:hypothetical protein